MQIEDDAHGVVELADAGEPGGEGHIGEGQVGGLDEHPGGLGALGPGQGQGIGADLGLEQPLQLAGGVAERGRPGR